MIIMKLSRHQAYKTQFLSCFNFVFSYTLDKKNQKSDLLVCLLNNFLSNEKNYYQYISCFKSDLSVMIFNYLSVKLSGMIKFKYIIMVTSLFYKLVCVSDMHISFL